MMYPSFDHRNQLRECRFPWSNCHRERRLVMCRHRNAHVARRAGDRRCMQTCRCDRYACLPSCFAIRLGPRRAESSSITSPFRASPALSRQPFSLCAHDLRRPSLRPHEIVSSTKPSSHEHQASSISSSDSSESSSAGSRASTATDAAISAVKVLPSFWPPIL